MSQAQTGKRDRAARRAAGAYYTPAPIVKYIVQRTLGPLIAASVSREPQRITVLDPACGAGAFLTEAYRYLLAQRLEWYVESDAGKYEAAGRVTRSVIDANGWRLTTSERRRVLLEQVFGVELSPQAAHETRLALANLALPESDQLAPSAPRGYAIDALLTDLEANIRQGDALLGPDIRQAQFRSPAATNRSRPFDWQAAFGQVFKSGGFDAILTNPPYVNIRLLSKTYDEGIKKYLATRYSCATGSYDLYVLFVERSFELLRPGGICGMITPNKLATLDYAGPCRELLLNQTTLLHLADVSGLNVFPNAGVYPYITVWQKSPPDAEHLVRVLPAASAKALESSLHARREATLTRSAKNTLSEPLMLCISQAELAQRGTLAMHGSLDIESRVPTEPLSSRCKLHSGATGFGARQLCGQLVEAADLPPGTPSYEFIVSGNIDRYAVQRGNVRFMKHSFLEPRLPVSAAGLSKNKQALYGGHKIVIAGMTKRLEAALDSGGLALGVQVYAAAECRDDPRYLLALLNSKLFSYLFRTRFRAKELAGGFLAINKGQLAQLPVRVIDETNPDEIHLRTQLIKQVEVLLAASTAKAAFDQLAERCIDELVYRLYRLTAAEIERVETEFQAPSTRRKAA